MSATMTLRFVLVDESKYAHCHRFEDLVSGMYSNAGSIGRMLADTPLYLFSSWIAEIKVSKLALAPFFRT